jgi:hypothetical protein
MRSAKDRVLTIAFLAIVTIANSTLAGTAVIYNASLHWTVSTQRLSKSASLCVETG